MGKKKLKMTKETGMIEIGIVHSPSPDGIQKLSLHFPGKYVIFLGKIKSEPQC